MRTAPTSTLARRWIPERSLVSDTGLVIAFSLFTGLMAHIAIPLPFTPVPITGQTFAVLLCGALLGTRLGTASMLAYIVEGLIGLPVFAAAPGAASYGYLAGFVAAAFVVGWFADMGWTKDLPRTVVAMSAGEVAIYFFGLLWLAHFVPPSKVLDFGLFPFLIGDAIKLAAAATVVPAGWRLSRAR
ncbi:MAG TPA: biotin transporter BioY [Candidatus Dormibacteraeota bacterium]|nr:biotin transporter BioY [Candidatus Dormibacteraeota bacterium]